MTHHFEGTLGAEQGPVPNLGKLETGAALSGLSLDRQIGVQVQTSQGVPFDQALRNVMGTLPESEDGR